MKQYCLNLLKVKILCLFSGWHCLCKNDTAEATDANVAVFQICRGVSARLQLDVNVPRW